MKFKHYLLFALFVVALYTAYLGWQKMATVFTLYREIRELERIDIGELTPFQKAFYNSVIHQRRTAEEGSQKRTNAKFVKIYVKDGAYNVDSNDIRVKALGDFLCDVRSESSIIAAVNQLYDDKYASFNSITTTVKKDGDYVNVMTDLHASEEFKEETTPHLHLHRDGLIHVLSNWYEFVLSDGQEFLVTCEGGHLQVTLA
ncbi:MAG: hypothetical protein M1114_01195 [Candidatus Dependentiae bacterium]|nr:hypothetical protein [Candidatus Dependentiae bacterium]